MGGKQKDLTGQRFGKLTALEPTPGRKNGYILWRCRCDCGKELCVPSRYLKNGWAQDCGCTPKEKKYRDLTGERFGKLIVLGESEKRDATGRVLWRCRCDCGGEVESTSGQLVAGYRKSCGCLSHPPLKNWIGKRFGTLEVISYAGKRNGLHYWRCRCHCGCGQELDVAQSCLQSGHTQGCGSLNWNRKKDWAGQEFGDLTVLSYAGKRDGNHFWHCRCVCGQELDVSQTNLLRGHTRSCGCRADPRRYVHFVEGTCVESIRSRKVFVNNTSGVRGVYQNKKTGKWHAQITFQGKTRFLGSYDQLEDAAKARVRAEEIFDDFLERYDRGLLTAEQGETATTKLKRELAAMDAGERQRLSIPAEALTERKRR